MNSTYAAIASACAERPPLAALILGSGLNQVTDDLPLRHAVGFNDLPDMPRTTVASHRGRLCLHEFEHRTVLAFQGRLHFYEGHLWDVVAQPVRLARQLGAQVLLLTNASGGIGPQQEAGALMTIRDHIAAMTPHWWRQPATPSPYCARLLDLVKAAAIDAKVELTQGVYACVTGPNYETPAEVRMLRTIGADAVGMSTVHEASTAAALGMEVAGISCVANRAAGLSPTPLSHAEVLAAVSAAAGRMARLIRSMLSRLK